MRASAPLREISDGISRVQSVTNLKSIFRVEFFFFLNNRKQFKAWEPSDCSERNSNVNYFARKARYVIKSLTITRVYKNTKESV